ncbi:cation:proton antiporter domain-containing protein [Lentzea flaviverrucosa]|uniref:Kef-type K+ transport system, membrane component KefB n=1 Tax=Lentzea flaviverrucosa TaxID=200379 RepID=A0A1H9SEM2_9PSEU|nr:cation:proton antiporter [Lentzea flaviverrucosa]RDI25329.1 Kef-type K+ transport system membrane component KefB [Lentzea flaviverrucosa]SER83045.1 Kef-type K+ transport system, membrane component KefB [Lentzea flaviverrucosa]
MSHIVILLVDLALIIALARILGAAARRLGQPPVIGEVLAGVLVLPLIVTTAPGAALFPSAIRADLSVLANIGVALFMFVVGMELDLGAVRRGGRMAISVAVTSVALPFGFGLLVALVYADQHAPAGARTGFLMFFAVAMAVTAFPVLARILTDRGMHHTTTGSLALVSAAINDVLAWVLLAVAVALSGQGGNPPWLLALSVPYLAVMLGVVRPLLTRIMPADRALSPGSLAVVVGGLLLSAAVTEWIGLHLIFGAFLFGTVMPRNGVRQLVHDRVAELNSVLLLPIFFIAAGLAIDFSALGAGGLGALALILAAAISGKFLGAFAAARLCGAPVRQAAVLGTLMNTRGLTELVVLSIGVQLGLLNQQLYTLMVIMALVTTAMAAPLLSVLQPQRTIDEDLRATAATPVPGRLG